MLLDAAAATAADGGGSCLISQVARLRASKVASSRRQAATVLALASAALAVGGVVAALRVVYGYDHGDVLSFALGLAVAVVPALFVWALPLLAFAPRQAPDLRLETE